MNDYIMKLTAIINTLNAATLRAHGLDVAVMGTAMFGSADPAADMAAIHAL